MKIAIMGCSFSSGEECRDWEILPLNDETLKDGRRKHSMPHVEYRNLKLETLLENGWSGYEEWNCYCDKFEYASLLGNEGHSVVNFSKRGMGLNFHHFIHTLPLIPEEFITNKINNKLYHWSNQMAIDSQDMRYKSHLIMGNYWPEFYVPDSIYPTNNFENHAIKDAPRYYNSEPKNFDYILDADVLIWQRTMEPRLTLTQPFPNEKDQLLIGGAIDTTMAVGWIENQIFSEKEKSILKNYYENLYDGGEQYAKDLRWIESILRIRKESGKRTIVITLSPTNVENVNINYYNAEVHAPKEGLLSKLVGINKVKDYVANYGHLNDKGHELIKNYLVGIL